MPGHPSRILQWSGPFAVLLSATLSAAAPLEEPYSVWIESSGARVYSGPGDEYYAAQQLEAGTECRVYDELPDGWLAIRPPEGSFSVVSRTALEPVSDAVARVVRQGTPSRVGSLLTRENNAVHVRLDEGELVQLVEQDVSADSLWAKILPPAGEFRWIRSEDASREPIPKGTKRDKQPPSETADATAEGEWQQRPEETEGDEATLQHDSDAEPIRIASHDEPSEEGAPADAESQGAADAENSRPTESPTFATRLNRLEVQLSRRVAGPPNLWVFDDLEQSAAQLLGQAGSRHETAAVNDLARRLQRFADISQRYRASNLPAQNAAAGGSADVVSTSGGDSDSEASYAQYDAVGVLRPVVSQRGNAPPYALVNERGDVVTFVTPSPSLNLQQHLGQRVGVSGTRSYVPEYRRRNIQTARVTPVTPSLVR